MLHATVQQRRPYTTVFYTMGRYVPDALLENLKNYKYNAVDKSITSKYVLNHFWNQFALLWPPWIAPNTVITPCFRAHLYSG